MLRKHQTKLSNDWINTDDNIGKSILAVEFDGGVVIGVDSKPTTTTTIGDRVSSTDKSDKLIKITDYICFCRPGSEADTQIIATLASYALSKQRVQMQGDEPLVETGASVFRELCDNYGDSLMSGILVAGWDRSKGGQIYSICYGEENYSRQPMLFEGSHAIYIQDYIDACFNSGISKEDCIAFVINSIGMGCYDSSGNIIRLAIISQSGIERRIIANHQLSTLNNIPVCVT